MHVSDGEGPDTWMHQVARVIQAHPNRKAGVERALGLKPSESSFTVTSRVRQPCQHLRWWVLIARGRLHQAPMQCHTNGRKPMRRCRRAGRSGEQVADG